MIDAVVHAVRKLLSLDLLRESKQMQNDARKNIEATNVMLQLDGEEKWMLNLCKTKKDGEKECMPDDNKP